MWDFTEIPEILDSPAILGFPDMPDYLFIKNTQKIDINRCPFSQADFQICLTFLFPQS